MGIGLNLQKILNDRQLTKMQLSEISGVSYNTIMRMIKEDKYGRRSLVEKISKCLGITTESLISEDLQIEYEDIINDDTVNNISFNQDLRGKKVFLIDFENDTIDTSNFNFLYIDNSVSYCFFNSNIYSTKYFDMIRLPNIKSTVVPIYTTKVTNQLVDHLILFYVGFITSKFKDTEVYIVSGDKGYQEPIQYIKDNFKSKVEFLLLTKYTPLCNYINTETQKINTIDTVSDREVACTGTTSYSTSASSRNFHTDKLHGVYLAFCAHIKRSSLFTSRVAYNQSVIYKQMDKFIDGRTNISSKTLFEYMVKNRILTRSTDLESCYFVNRNKICRIIKD